MKASEIMLGTKELVVKALWKEVLASLASPPVAWPQEIHAIACARLVANLFEVEQTDPRILKLYELFDTKGLAGNPSQCQKWLVEEKLLPERAKKASSLAAQILGIPAPAPAAEPPPPAPAT